MKKLISLVFIGACALAFSGCPPEKTQTNITPDGGSSAPEPTSGTESATGTTTPTPTPIVGTGSPVAPAK